MPTEKNALFATLAYLPTEAARELEIIKLTAVPLMVN